MEQSKRCKATTRDGNQCTLPPVKGSEYCRHHRSDPAFEAKGITIGLPLSYDTLASILGQAYGHEKWLGVMFQTDGPSEVKGWHEYQDRLVLSFCGPVKLTISYTSPDRTEQVEMVLPGHPIPVTLYEDGEAIACIIYGKFLLRMCCEDWGKALGQETLSQLRRRNDRLGFKLPLEALQLPCTETVIPVPDLKPIEIPAFTMATFKEAREFARTICGRADQFDWDLLRDGAVLKRERTTRAMDVEFDAGRWKHWPIADLDTENIMGLLLDMNTDTVLLFQAALCLVQEYQEVTISVDTLIQMIGWKPGNVRERVTMRNRIISWLRNMDMLRVIGDRLGSYEDPLYPGRKLDLGIDTNLFTTDIIADNFVAYGPTRKEQFVTLRATKWLEALRKHAHALTRFGNLQLLASIPGGRPGGSWARGIGMALYQYWREQASKSRFRRTGDEKIIRVRFSQALTRRYLLTYFGCTPRIEDVLQGKHPERAHEYWDSAIDYLHQVKATRIIDSINYTPIASNRGKAYWDEWLNQSIVINPHRLILRELARIKYQRRKPAQYDALRESIEAMYPA